MGGDVLVTVVGGGGVEGAQRASIGHSSGERQLGRCSTESARFRQEALRLSLRQRGSPIHSAYTKRSAVVVMRRVTDSVAGSYASRDYRCN